MSVELQNDQPRVMTSRIANVTGIVSAVVLPVLLSLEWWIRFNNLWTVEVVGLLFNSAMSFYAARRGNRRWYVLLALNLLAILLLVLSLYD